MRINDRVLRIWSFFVADQVTRYDQLSGDFSEA